MPPRIPVFQCLRAPPTPCSRTLTSSATANASTVTQKRRHHDPYAIAQAKARKAANISRQEVLKKERAASFGDPVRGTTTSYLRSFDTATAPESPALPKSPETQSSTSTSTSPDTAPQPQNPDHLNFYLTPSELSDGLTHSRWLTTTPVRPESSHETYTSDTTPEELEAAQQTQQETAAEALRRISSLSVGSSKDRLRVNIQRCIEDFGRHSTDATLAPPIDALTLGTQQMEKTPRVGPDTGSSEVQIAILTAKIRTLADFLESRGHMDKMNKRNLRLLVHRRQKLLRYLRRKERGGPRWKNVVETLGLGEGTWRGEITLGR